MKARFWSILLAAVVGVFVVAVVTFRPSGGTVPRATANATRSHGEFVLLLTSDRRILVEGQPISLEQLPDVVRAAGVPPRGLIIRGESGTPYDFTMEVLDALSPHSNLLASSSVATR